MADVERTAKSILLRAQSQAEQLLAAAQAEAETLKQQARAEGLAEGRREGTAQGLTQGKQAGQQQALTEHRGQLEKAIAAMSAAMKALEQSRDQLESAGLIEVVQLALSVARRVTKRQATIDPQVLATNLAEAMKLAVKSADIRIAIHPSQRATLDAALPQLTLQWPNLNHVQIVEDNALHPGGCRILTEQGRISADLDEQLGRIAAELLPSAEISPSPSGRGQG